MILVIQMDGPLVIAHNTGVVFSFQQATCKFERKIASLRAQQQHIHKRLKEAEVQFLDNDGWLHRVENEMKLLKTNDEVSEVSKHPPSQTICG